jgi:hypothetical protein
MEHYIGNTKSLNSPYLSLESFINSNGQENPFSEKIKLSEYDEYNFVSLNKNVD